MQYRTFNYNKLVRDKMVERSEATGSIVHWKKLDDKEFEQALRIKCMEEAEEIFSAQTKGALIEELADMLEIIHAFCDMYQVTLKDVVEIQEKKYQERGSFKDHIFISTADHVVDSFGEKYCLADPEKYPEIKNDRPSSVLKK